ncbi:MAG: endopeptidase La [Pseudomonadota bacterium]
MSDERETEDYGERVETGDYYIPEELPLLAVRDIVIFPYMILPLFIGREPSIKAVEEAIAKDRLIFLATQKDQTIDSPLPEQINKTGTVAMIMRVLKLPDGRVKILVQGLSKARVLAWPQVKPMFRVKIEPIRESEPGIMTTELEALMRNVREQSEKILSLKGILSADVMAILNSVEEPGRLADLVASNLRLKLDEAQEILEINDSLQRLQRVNDHLSKELEVSTMQAKIQSEAKEEMSRTQREYFLREQLRAIRRELGEIDERAEEVEDLRLKIKKARMSTEAEQEAGKQLKRLEQMHPDAAEACMVRTFLDWMIEIPWSKSTRDRLDVRRAKTILDEDHYNLERVKERILEYLSVRKLNKDMKGPILCLVGPPGVGKTSLGRSIARALGRRFVRMSLGGVRDEAEIRGHRRTYIGALPGRIIQGLKTAKSNNPVFMMDEIDKIGADFRGDPSSALLEVLDPEQNSSFSDHYINVPFDLSKVMFITTANLTDPIPSALKDRMEIIDLPGYTDEEKLRIARGYLLPRQLKENGLKPSQMVMSNPALLSIISSYTREAGLRNLEREIAAVCRKTARRVAEGERRVSRVSRQSLASYLGPPKFIPEGERGEHEVGVATGLAWTPFGGEILHIEATVVKGKGRLSLTGQLGDVMKESAQAALSYIRSRADRLGLAEGFYEKHDIHIHIPAGAIPKDGPSAGVTMAAALVSAFTKVPVCKDVAATGEITLRGRVLPIGGLKEKALAAVRAHITRIVVPEDNRKDLMEIPANIKRRLRFVFVKNIDQVLTELLAEAPVASDGRKTIRPPARSRTAAVAH